ncbi:MAG: hypothetical protein LUQ11_00260 [Methylococcaceae bacterium]|nr:hypothetical protein [Methylococcaceae bacterium]
MTFSVKPFVLSPSKHERFGAVDARIFPSILRQAQDERENPSNPKQGSYL